MPAEGEQAPPTAELEHPATLEDARSWAGFKLDDAAGATAGRVEGVLVDAQTGEPVWVLIRGGGVFGRRTAVPFAFAAASHGRVWVPLSRELIRSAPEVDPARGLDVEAEAELCAHFGIVDGVGRMAALAGLDPGTQSSTPA